MSEEKYIILTGSKNNAGDFLIKRKSISLLQRLRQDREVVSYDAWKPISDPVLDEINNSKALILAGGPSLQTNMYPNIYNLINNLDHISVPIITMGIGSKHHDYTENGYRNYFLSNQSLKLLEKINNNYTSSVRDDFTLNILKEHGFHNFINTGCAVLYQNDSEKFKTVNPEKNRNVYFSLGVSYKYSLKMMTQMKSVISYLNHKYNIIVLLHHQINNTDRRLSEILDWLTMKEIKYYDISGNSGELIKYYSNCYFHIGYRVHAHMYCLSIEKPSILLAEDSRGTGLNETVNSSVFNSYSPKKISFLTRLKLKLNIDSDLYQVNHDLVGMIDSEINTNLFSKPKQLIINKQIAKRYNAMKSFCANLP
jgi:hypothetical protein